MVQATTRIKPKAHPVQWHPCEPDLEDEAGRSRLGVPGRPAFDSSSTPRAKFGADLSVWRQSHGCLAPRPPQSAPGHHGPWSRRHLADVGLQSGIRSESSGVTVPVDKEEAVIAIGRIVTPRSSGPTLATFCANPQHILRQMRGCLAHDERKGALLPRTHASVAEGRNHIRTGMIQVVGATLASSGPPTASTLGLDTSLSARQDAHSRASETDPAGLAAECQEMEGRKQVAALPRLAIGDSGARFAPNYLGLSPKSWRFGARS